MQSYNWQKSFKGLNAAECYKIFLQEYGNACEIFVPLRKPSSSREPLWSNPEIKRLIRLKHKLWYRIKSSSSLNDTEFKENYKSTCKLVKKMLTRARIDFESKLVRSAKTEPKLLYSYIRRQQGGRDNINEPKEIAELLNNYFQSVFVQPVDKNFFK